MSPAWRLLIFIGVALTVRLDTVGAAQPNVVLVFADDLGIGDVGYHADLTSLGAFSTPVLDDLAASGTVLSRFYANHACTPARASLMTGRFASRTNLKSPILRETARGLNEEEELLPEVLKDLGYQTHMVGKWHLGMYARRFHPVGRGFDSFCGTLGGSVDYFYHNSTRRYLTQGYQGLQWQVSALAEEHFGTETPGDEGYLPHDFSCATATGGDDAGKCAEYSFYYEDDITSQQTYEMQISQPTTESATPDDETYGEFYSTNIFGQKSVDVIEAHNPANGPLFLYAAFTAGHSPLQALDSDFADCDPAIRDSDRLVLCAMVKALDRNVGYIVDALKAKSMWEDTFFVFASDNGGSTNRGSDNGSLKGGKGDMYEGGIMAPAFLHFGSNTVETVDLTSGIVNDQPIHLVDLFRTFVAAALDGGANYNFQNEIDGRDLWTYLSQGSTIPSDVASVNFNFAAGPGFISSTSKSEYNDDGSYVEAVIATYEGTDFKLCRNCAGEFGDEIFDLTADPAETTNLAGSPEYADVAEFLDDTLASWVEVSYPYLPPYPTVMESVAELLEGADLDPELADGFVNDNRCFLPFDSPEFLCSDCSQLLLGFPDTVPP